MLDITSVQFSKYLLSNDYELKNMFPDNAKPSITHLAINPILCPVPNFKWGGLNFLNWGGERQGEVEEVGFCIPNILPTQSSWISQVKWVPSNWEIPGISTVILEFLAGPRT